MPTFRDQNTHIIDNFRGLYLRQTIRENVPPGYMRGAQNCQFTDKAIRNREGASIVGSIPATNYVRVHLFRLSTAPTVQRFIYLDTAGNFFDPVVSLAVPILTEPTATDFSIICLFDRVYIAPHNRVRGIGFLYVYEPLIATTARLAGGTPPTTPVTAVTSATTGNIQAGIHLFAVASETSSGFITRYDIAFPGGFPTYLAPGGFAVDLTVPFGDPGTVKRHILATKRIPSFDGNAANYEFFFIDEIPDNVTPNITVDFIDSQLVDSADFLLDQLEDIPSFVQMCTYQGSMIGVGEDENPSIARVSKSGEPESFSASEGFVIVNPGEGGGLKNCTEYRNTLVLFKSFKTYSTISNGAPPNTWPVTEIDSALGTECFGLGKLFDDPGGVTNDALIIATRAGLHAFDGSYAKRPLSWVIEELWINNQDFTNFSKVQVYIDPIAKMVYVNIPDQTQFGLTTVLTMDYSDGLNFDAVRWANWFFDVPGAGGFGEIRSIGVVFSPTFLPRFFMMVRIPSGMLFIRVEAQDEWGTDPIQAIATMHPVNPNGLPALKIFSGGYGIAETVTAGTITINSQAFTIPLTGNIYTFSYTRNDRVDYLQEIVVLESSLGTVSLNKLVLMYKDDMDEVPK